MINEIKDYWIDQVAPLSNVLDLTTLIAILGFSICMLGIINNE